MIVYKSCLYVHTGIREERISAGNSDARVKDHRIARENLYGERLTVIGHIRERNPVWFDGSGDAGHVLHDGAN